MLTTCVLAGVVFSAVKVADQIQKEITAKRSEVDNLRSKVRRLEEKMETVTKVGVTSLVSMVFGTVTSLVSFVFGTVTSLVCPLFWGQSLPLCPLSQGQSLPLCPLSQGQSLPSCPSSWGQSARNNTCMCGPVPDFELDGKCPGRLLSKVQCQGLHSLETFG